MLTKIKKPVSILLSLIMVFSMFAIVPFSASATGEYVAENDYLKFTAKQANSSVTIRVASGFLQYKKNNSSWAAYTDGTQINLNNGDYVRFRGTDTTFDDDYHVEITGKVAASGNVMSLRLDNNGRSQGLADECFWSMFWGCTGLTSAPVLPETTLATDCYTYMFAETSLTTAPALPATTLASCCYYGMFEDCTSLTTAPALPATTLKSECYCEMFQGCTSLTTAPALPATTLAENCYSYMFKGCTSLTTPPALPATTLKSECYSNMFYGCSGIKLSATQTAAYGIPYKVPSGGNGTTATNALSQMFAGTGGTFKGTPVINTTYFLYGEAPKYTITWKNDGGSLIDTTTVAYGTVPTHANPTKAATAQYTYTFNGWNPTPVAVTGAATYTATFSSTLRSYTITWNNDDGTLIDTTTVAYGTVPTHADPTKADDDQYTYTFAGWNTTPVAVTGEATYTATFTQTEKNPNDQMSVSINDQIHLNLFLDLDFRGKTVNDVSITLAGQTYTCTGTQMTGGDFDGLYKFKVEMAPAQIADAIVVTINGDANPLTTSVMAYCNALQNPVYGATASEKALGLAILDYGQAANNVFLDGANEIADISALDPTAARNAAAVFSDSTGKVTGASFMALTKPEFRFYTASIDEYTAAKFYNEAGITAAYSGDNAPSEPLNARFVKNAEGEIFIEVTGVSAENMDKTITVTVNGMPEGQNTITFNGNTFAKAMARDTNPAATQALGAALYNYGVAAKVCFAAGQETPAQNIVDMSTLTGAYEAQDGDVLTGVLGGDYQITIADGATVTLKDVDITCLSNSDETANFAGITPLGDATIMLEGANTVKGGYEDFPGIFVPEDTTLTIDGTGSLDASSNDYGCGIGGGYRRNAGNIEINGGNITATGGEFEAGIGSGNQASCGDITITGGTVNATGGNDGAGIGGGDGASSTCGNIVINGGNITATGGNCAAGIGGGQEGSCGAITIAGGTVNATGGESGAGIGSGNDEGSCGNIDINGGNITATGGDCAAGIGSGECGGCGDITINGGTVNATGGNGGAGIGSGEEGSCGDITIADTVTQVTATMGDEANNSIGAGEDGDCGTVTIEDGANVIQN